MMSIPIILTTYFGDMLGVILLHSFSLHRCLLHNILSHYPLQAHPNYMIGYLCFPSLKGKHSAGQCIESQDFFEALDSIVIYLLC